MDSTQESSSIEVEDGRPGLVKRLGMGNSSPGFESKNAWNKPAVGDENELSIEQIFDSKKVPLWWEQITIRGLFASMVIGILLSIIVMKFNLTTGVIPSLNVSAGLLGFFFIKTWTKILEKAGLLITPFTRQENTVIQTCVVACTGIAFSGGFGSYMFAMSSKVASQVGNASPGFDAKDIKNPELSWMIGYLFVVSFTGLFSVVSLRKIMIIDYKLTYPSGTATAVLINGFHTPQGAKVARKQVLYLGKFFVASFLWGFFQWFYKAGDGCGFENFPTLGLQAYANKFYFDFSTSYIGAGMICPHLVNVSLLVGSIISYGIMWPLIEKREGDWYPANLPENNSLHGLTGYKVFISISLILGDGLYNFVKVMFVTFRSMYGEWKKKKKNESNQLQALDADITYDEQRRTEIFIKDAIPWWMAVCGYVGLSVISMGVIPTIFPPMKWYYILVAYIIAPVLAFCNAYGCGLTDWSLASNYGKLAIFIFGAWAGKGNGGVLAGLASCGVMLSIVSTASDLSQDFKTGYLTLSSPRSMFVSQVLGTAMGCIIGPCTFWLFYKAFDVGAKNGEYSAPFGELYRGMAILGVEGFSSLPHNCLKICYGFFAFAIAINIIRDRVPRRVCQYIPLPMAMAIPFYLGGYFAIDMFVGTVIVFIWQSCNRKSADVYVPAVASGLLCGGGIWSLPESILALAKVKPPICMKFLSRTSNIKVDDFLNT
ncbi:hypothetical protein SUGI_0837370 [Cryptomeria japonica]|uniref:probable metal-nicotianamine transporter YSL12 isoform X2 n=1 Tax=Cryptomeria japonica TaxID=3369 RepID=UPI0024147E0A|nr:probable metal-nicotianamine transporter YSL12 isoform X2 [Cryptomeria japonica]GLJ40569.1 hypothetical protein SUGI_0837370 [Cryptomeria japonica]